MNTFSVSRNTFEQTIDDNWNLQYDLSGSIRREAERVLKNNQFSLENAVLDVEYQNLSLEYANLWTPIEGIVTHVSVPFSGVNVTPAGADFEVVNPKTLFFQSQPNREMLLIFKKGQLVKLVLMHIQKKNLMPVYIIFPFLLKMERQELCMNSD